VDGISAIGARMAQIQGTIASMSAPTAAVAGSRASGTTSTTAAAGGFAAALAAALTDSTGAASAASGAGTLNAQGVPTELAAYGNGRIPDSALAEIGSTGERLWAPAARAFGQLSAAAARDGVSMSVTDSYRSLAGQVDVADRKGLYSQGGLAAVPGTSDHGWGRSLDLGLNATAQTWMRAHAGEYGFAADVPRESWHWTYSPPSA